MRTFLLVVLIAAIVAGPSAPVSAAVPICQLGGPTAMNPNRQLAEGETFVQTDGPLIVNLRFKPTAEHPQRVGECMLPAGSEVAIKDGILQWVRTCGNDEVNRNIVVDPVAFRAVLKGDKGEPGYTPVKGIDYFDGLDGKDYAPPPPATEAVAEEFRTKRKISTLGWVGIGLATALLIGLAAGSGGGGHSGTPPGGHTGGAF